MLDAFAVPQSLLVLGGTSDIAVATARAFVERGTGTVLLAGRDRSRLEMASVALANASHARVHLLDFDALNSDNHPDLVQQAVSLCGDIDVVILAFGVYRSELGEANGASPSEVLDTNLRGAVSVTTPLVARLREQGHGAIVVLSSMAAERGRQSEFVYAASKAGLDAYFQGLRDSLHGTGVRIMIVRPGAVRTKMSAGRKPKPWATSPEKVAAAIVRALEQQRATVYVPAALRWIAPIVRHLPAAIFRRMTAKAAQLGVD